MPAGSGVFLRTVAFAGFAFALLAPLRPAASADALPRLGVASERTSVSGLSSGAYMAEQFQVAHSKTVIGAGLIAGGPYACAESSFARIFPFWAMVVETNAEQALHECMKTDWGLPNVGDLVDRTKALAESGGIDPLDGLADDRVYLYSGKDDHTVEHAVVEAAADFYRSAGVPSVNVLMVEGQKGGHAFLTEDAGGACGISAAPYISDCDFDQAGAILTQILGHPAPKAAEASGRFITFDQRPFAHGVDNGFADEGVVYVPAACAAEAGCVAHVVFHGCEQGRERVHDDFVRESGFARWADSNRLVILFPQIAASSANPYGCWDWWGYTGLDYLGKEAPQIAGVSAMLTRITERNP